jgi:hypothetical protein
MLGQQFMKLHLLLLSASVIWLSGCQTYVYRVVQPPGITQPVTDKPVTLRYDPLEYQLVGYKDRLAMRISNPTDDRIVLLGDRSYVVDPLGESHPLRTHILGPHSFTRMLLPPIPFTYAYPDWSWGWAWAPYDPFWGPFWGPAFYGPPSVSYYQVNTQYDWTWKTGDARMRFSYDRSRRLFEHNFEIIREPQK